MKKVFKYVDKNNNLLGYHCCSFCSTSDNIKDAKVYTCSNEESVVIQSQIILHNFIYFTNNVKNKQLKEGYFKGIKVSSIYVIPENVD